MPPGQSKRARIERALEFWRDKRIQRVLLSDGTIAVFGKLVSQCASIRIFSFEHAQALVMAVSLLESQIRDCIRLAIGDVRSPIDLDHPFLKDLSIDASLFAPLRDRSFTLGEFVFLNTGVSTVPQLWSAMEFCFPIKLDVAFEY